MAYPSEYDRAYSFTAFAQAQGDNSFPGTPLDNELDDIELSIDEINEFLENGFRADGHISNGLVTWDSLDAALKAKFQASGAAPNTAVDPAVVYAGPPSGPDALPTFRALATTDLPNLLQSGISAIPVSLFTRAAGKPQFEDYGQTQKNIAALRAIVPSVDKADILVQGYHTAGFGGGVFSWDAASVLADDGGLVIQPTDHAPPGRWTRNIDGNGRIHSKWFGARGDAVTDDTLALQTGIDRAKALGMGYELDIGDYVTGPLKLNGSTWQPTDITGQQAAVLCFVGNGRSPFLCRLIALAGAYSGDLKAVITGRNMAGVVVSNFSINANNVAECCADLAYIGNGPGGVAPSCNNEFTSLWGSNATKVHFDLRQAADCLVSGIHCEGGTASVGIDFRLGGGGIWMDNCFTPTSAKLLLACQNAGLQNCGFFGGVEIDGPALNMPHFDACHIYPYTPRRTLLADPFTTTNGSAVVVVSMPGHGLVNGNYVELAGCVDTNGILAANLNTSAATPRAITYIDVDSFSIVAGAAATSSGAAGGTTVAITGRGYSVYSSATEGNGPRSLTMTSCWLNVLGVAGQKHFAGRWLNGARFDGCRFGNNVGEPAATNIYFDATNWTPAGSSSTLPLFFFDNCSFSVGRPVSIASKVLVGFSGGYIGTSDTSETDFEWPGAFNLSKNAFGTPANLNGLRVWNDAASHIRTKASAPGSATDGNMLVERQSGVASPQSSVTPSHQGALFADGTAGRIYMAYNTTNTSWLEPVRLRTGTATPVGFNTPTRVGEILVDTTNNRVYVSKALTNADWIEVTAVAGVYQPLDSDLTAIAALTSAADQMPYATGAGTWALATVTAAARTLLDDTTIALMLATLTITNATGGTTLGSTNTASGANATAIGSGNTASNTSTVAMGNASQATGSVAIAIGNGAVSSGAASVALGQNLSASGAGTFVHGNRATDRGTNGSRAFGAGQFSATGDAQFQEAVFRITTAAAAAVRLTTDGAAASATNVLALANNSSYLILAECIIRDVTTGKTVTYTLGPSMVERGANAAATAVSAGNPVFVAGPASAVPPVLAAIPTLTADTTNGGLNISFTPPAANTDTFHAVCYVRSTQVV